MVTDGGPWRGPSEEEWLERIARPSTPVTESIPWIKREKPRSHEDMHRINQDAADEVSLSELEKLYLWGDR